MLYKEKYCEISNDGLTVVLTLHYQVWLFCHTINYHIICERQVNRVCGHFYNFGYQKI